jgi:hypothetical protein
MGIIESAAEKKTSESLAANFSNTIVTGIKIKSQKTEGFKYLFICRRF